MSTRVKLTVQGLISSKTQLNTYALVLGDESRKKRITVIIGQAEAESIALQLQSISTPRPMTHAMMLNTLKGFNIELAEVNIHHYENGIFHSELLWVGNGKTLTIDARTSDAIALAIRESSPVFIDGDIFESLAIVADEDTETSGSEPDDTRELSLEELERQLEKAVTNENYEEAAALRDEIKKRKEYL
jgi:bifunctional DNase/RNase